MPFIRDFGEGYGDEDFDDRPKPGESEYVPPEAYRYQNVTEEIDGPARVILDFLLAAGVTEFRVNYDGGHDEGFAHPDSFRIGGQLWSVEQVVDDLVRPEVLSKLAGEGEKSHYIHSDKLSDQQAVAYAVDDLANELASRLLGRGYGTGEYTMYGAFVADLQTLEITDDPDAAPRVDWG